jgi:hypothetical protein
MKEQFPRCREDLLVSVDAKRGDSGLEVFG